MLHIRQGTPASTRAPSEGAQNYGKLCASVHAGIIFYPEFALRKMPHTHIDVSALGFIFNEAYCCDAYFEIKRQPVRLIYKLSLTARKYDG